jgi:type II secretory pathway component PulC
VKNKKITYILLPLALLIWGIIVYKIFFYTADEENGVFLSQTEKIKTTTQIAQDTFDLQLNYQDPFLKNVANTTVQRQTGSEMPKSQEPKPAPKTVEKTVVFPALRYEGIVKHISRGKALAIININGKSKFVQTGETVDNIKLEQVYNDSIIVSYEKQYKTIRKK